MEIPFFSKQMVSNLFGTKVFCWGMIKDNLIELFQEYAQENLDEQIVAIIDNNPKKQGSIKVGGRSFSVISSDCFLREEAETITVIITNDYHEDVLDQIENIDCLYCKNVQLYRFVNRIEKIDLEYRKRYETAPLEDIILFRSGPYRKDYVKGTDYWDNSRALFEYMLEHKYNKKYQLVWFVKNPDDFSKFSEIENVDFLSFDWEDSANKEERDRYYRALCLAKYIFTTDAYGFAKNARKDQVRIQLWHGCGFKTRNNFIRCEHRYDYTTVVSELYADIHADIYGLRKDQVLITGYAKHDWLFRPYEKDLAKLLGIKQSEKYLFWLPTFRMADDSISSLNQYEINPDTGLPIVINREQLIRLNGLLEESGITLVIKLHPLQKTDLVKNYQMDHIAIFSHMDLLERGLELNRLLASADAMVSDYSSAAVDYLVLDRPMAFTLDDVDAYRNSRGFVFENIKEWLPGQEIYSFGDFCSFIKDVSNGTDVHAEKRHKVASQLLAYKDNHNCERILKALEIFIDDKTR